MLGAAAPRETLAWASEPEGGRGPRKCGVGPEGGAGGKVRGARPGAEAKGANCVSEDEGMVADENEDVDESSWNGPFGIAVCAGACLGATGPAGAAAVARLRLFLSAVARLRPPPRALVLLGPFLASNSDGGGGESGAGAGVDVDVSADAAAGAEGKGKPSGEAARDAVLQIMACVAASAVSPCMTVVIAAADAARACAVPAIGGRGVGACAGACGGAGANSDGDSDNDDDEEADDVDEDSVTGAWVGGARVFASRGAGAGAAAGAARQDLDWLRREASAAESTAQHSFVFCEGERDCKGEGEGAEVAALATAAGSGNVRYIVASACEDAKPGAGADGVLAAAADGEAGDAKFDAAEWLATARRNVVRVGGGAEHRAVKLLRVPRVRACVEGGPGWHAAVAVPVLKVFAARVEPGLAIVRFGDGVRGEGREENVRIVLD